MATIAPVGAVSNETFYRRMAVGLAAFILFAFFQFALRGFVDYRAAPLWVHLHGAVFVSWLALFIAQALLAERGSLALHRRLGWAGAALALAMVLLGSYTGIRAVELGRVPPFFTGPFFLALTHVGVLGFGGLVGAAIAMRRRTDWHRRLMLGATVMLLEPAFGRLLPMPLLGADVGEALAMVLQLGVLAFAARHDQRLIARVHPALIWSAGVVVVAHLMVSLLARAPFLADLADRLAI